MSKSCNLRKRIPSSSCIRQRLVELVAEAKELGVLLRTAEELERVDIGEDDLRDVDIDSLLPPTKEDRDGQ